MSFRCGVCGEAQEPKASPNMVVVESRNVSYPERSKGKGRERQVIDSGGDGWEIVREVKACSVCYKNMITQE